MIYAYPWLLAPRFAHAAVGNGALYRCAHVTDCPQEKCMEKGGSVDVEMAIRKVKEAAMLLPDPFKIDDRNRTTYYHGKWVAY